MMLVAEIPEESKGVLEPQVLCFRHKGARFIAWLR